MLPLGPCRPSTPTKRAQSVAALTNNAWRCGDRRNFYKVEKWSRDGQHVEEMLFAGNSLDKAKRIFERFIEKRPRSRLTSGLSPPKFGGSSASVNFNNIRR